LCADVGRDIERQRDLLGGEPACLNGQVGPHPQHRSPLTRGLCRQHRLHIGAHFGVGVGAGCFEPAQRVKPVGFHPRRDPVPRHRLLQQINRRSVGIQHRRSLLHRHQISHQLSIRATIEHSNDYATSHRQFSLGKMPGPE